MLLCIVNFTDSSFFVKEVSSIFWGRWVVLFAAQLCQILQYHLYWECCIFFFLFSCIMLICEQKMEPIGGKKSQILKANLLHHVTSFPAGCIRTGNTLRIFNICWLQRGHTIKWGEHRFVIHKTLILSLTYCGILCNFLNFVPEFSHM